MIVSVHSEATRATRPASRPGVLASLVQTVAGTIVPLVILRPFRRVIRSYPAVLFPVAGLWLLVLFGNAQMFALKGFPPFEKPPKLDPLTLTAVGGAIMRAVIGVLQTQAVLMLGFDWLFFKAFANSSSGLEAFDRGVKKRIRFDRTVYSLIGTLFVIGFSLLPLAALLAALPAVAPDEAVLSDTVRPAATRWARFRRRLFAAFAAGVILVTLFGFSIEIVSRLPLPETGQLGPLAKKVLGFSMLDVMMPEPFLEKAPKDLPMGEQWYTSSELIEKRDTYREAAHRQTKNPDDQRAAAAKLAELERTIERRAPTSPRLRIMLDPDASRWLAKPLYTLLPPALIQHWPFVLLIVYGTDLLLLLLIGRVPLAYNFRYLWVRRRDTALTALAFTVVVAIVVVLLAFVNGMNKLNESTGIPGNVLVLSDGATDELFSNLSYGDISNVERVAITEDEKGRMRKPMGVARAVIGPDGKAIVVPPDTAKEKEPPGTVRLASFETYMVMNQPVPAPEGEKPRRRFLQVRAVRSAAIAAAVHNMDLLPGGKWFAEDGVHAESGG
jgi:putative ABC transport system permease protein